MRHYFSLVLCAALLIPAVANANKAERIDRMLAEDLYGISNYDDADFDEDDEMMLPEPNPDEPTEEEIASPVTGLPTFSHLGDDDDDAFEFEGPMTLADPETETTASSTATAPGTAGPGPLTLDVIGMQPLEDNYPLSVVAVTESTVVVELPVFLANNRLEVEGDFTLVVAFYVGDARVSEVRQLIQSSSLAEMGASFAFLKVQVPVVEPAGDIKAVVQRVGADGGTAEELFTTFTAYELP